MEQRGAIWGAAVMVMAQLGATSTGCSADGQRMTDEPGGSGTGGLASAGTASGGQGEGCSGCEVSVAKYCSAQDCTMPTDWCVSLPKTWAVTKRGGGCLRVEGWKGNTSEQPISVDVWNEESGELLYHFEGAEDGRVADEIVGTDPPCGRDEVCDTRQACVAPPHWECFGTCFTGCLPSGVSNCGEMEQRCLSLGMGGLGGGGPD